MLELLTAAGSALMGAMATDAWQQARQSAVSLWRSQPAEVAIVDADLVRARDEVLSARSRDDEQAETELAVKWAIRLGQLLEDNSDIADEIRLAQHSWSDMLPPKDQTKVRKVDMRAKASDEGRVYQAISQVINEK